MSLVHIPPEREADVEFLRGKEGWIVGQLEPGELAAFDRLCEAHLAHRSYEGGLGFMGLAKVRFA